MRWGPAAILLGACYGPHVTPGAPCDPDHPACPDGEMCVGITGAATCQSTGNKDPADAAGIVDTGDAPDGSSGVDSDGDGIPDAIDNCPGMANTDQANEDGDAFGDVCDPCPPIADDHPPDTDGDGVADACDPNPTMGGDRIVLFEGFGGGVPTSWVQTGGTWTSAAPGTASFAATQNQIGYLTLPDPSTTGHELISAAIRIDDITTLSAPRGIALAAEADPTLPIGIGCGLIMHSTGFKRLSLVDLASTGEFATTDLSYSNGDVVTLGERRDGTAYACGAVSPTQQKQVSATSSLTTPTPSIGLRMRSASATVYWLMVIEN